MHILDALISGIYENLGLLMNMDTTIFIEMIIVPSAFSYIGADNLTALFIYNQLAF